MNRHRNLLILLLLCSSLILRADSCVFQQKDVEQVAGVPIPAEWVSIGYTDANFSDTQSVSLAADIRDALPSDPTELSTIQSLGLAGVQYEVLESTGHDARRQGYVDVDGQRLLDFDIPNNQTGTSGAAGDGSGKITMGAAGTTLVASRLNSWLEQYKSDPFTADDSLLDFTFAVNWSSTPAPSSSDPDEFRWTTDVVIQVVTVVSIFD